LRLSPKMAKSLRRAHYRPPVRAVFLATLVSCVLWPTIDRAEAPASFGLDLDWNAEPGCPDRASAEAAVREILGPHVVTGGPSNVVQVNISALDRIVAVSSSLARSLRTH